ncbi:Sporulation/cell division region, bacteria domain protein [Candidatus Magnetobacterium bavaricum]|uniref:Sporulation/cell division region, bacteria domain protein n=1 Tax=Candidatus Magnetobacterium bavaricum TaxID=29290 RepID=A0A0F3H0A6_9BACT|nr:Sporulation/cell division region, bacteria domain protein [Candidatus Magnetobacterium bavaricum]
MVSEVLSTINNLMSEEFIRSLKEKNATRKKVIAGIVGLVFLVIVAGVYMFVVKGGSARDKQPIIAQKAKPPIVKPTPAPVVNFTPAPVVRPTPVAVKPTPEVVSNATPEPIKPQRIAPEYVAPEEVTPHATAKGQQKQKEKTTRKSPETVAPPVGKTHKSKEKTVVAKEAKAQVKVAKETRQLKPEKVPQEAVEPVQGAYTIQLGSFADPANAQRLKETLKKDGYSAFVKEFPAQPGQDITMHKVFVGSYKSKADAIKTVKKLRDTKNMELILKKM